MGRRKKKGAGDKENFQGADERGERRWRGELRWPRQKQVVGR